MARTAIPLTIGSHAGATGLGGTPDALGGITPPNSVVVIRNGSASSITVTAKAGLSAGIPTGLTAPDKILTIAAGAMAEMGPFDAAYWARDASVADGGQVYIDISLPTTVTWFAVQVRGVA